MTAAALRQHLTVAETAERLAVAPGTVRSLIRSGRLEGVRVAGAIRIAVDSLERYLAVNTIAPPAPAQIKPRSSRSNESWKVWRSWTPPGRSRARP